MMMEKKLFFLIQFYPSLGRPYVDHIKGSTIKNLKELRIQNKNRIFFAFDPERDINLLLGGDKKGDFNFYKEMIKKVEKLYKIHLKSLEV
jgi:hypothetical protein